MKKYEKVLSIILFILTATFLCFNVYTSSTEILPVKIALCAASIIIAGLTNYCIFYSSKKVFITEITSSSIYCYSDYLANYFHQFCSTAYARACDKVR